MAFILTAVASDTPLSAGHLAAIEGCLEKSGLQITGDPVWLGQHKAADLPLLDHPDRELWQQLQTLMGDDRIDLFITPKENRRKKLLLADMDSTIVDSETLDELAAYANLQEQIAAITEKAMQGELDFEAALFERVALLEGLSEEKLAETLENTELSPGAETLVKTMAGNGARCILVSGGFTFFTGAVAEKTGFHHHHGNVLEIANGALTGRVETPVLDKNSKRQFLAQYSAETGLGPDETLAIGDGANDLPMLLAAGMGIGYRPKKLLREKLDNVILYGELTAALYAQGYSQDQFAA